MTNVVFVVYTSADRRTLGDEWMLSGAIVCAITKSAILTSAQFNIATLFLYGPKSNHCVTLSYHCYLPVGFCMLDSLLRGTTVGYPSGSLASCTNRPNALLWTNFVEYKQAEDIARFQARFQFQASIKSENFLSCLLLFSCNETSNVFC